MKTILIQGDSITDAHRSRDDDSIMGVGYPLLVNGELSYRYPLEYNVYNRGISGNRIVDLYARIKEDIINLKPDVLSILIGVNDVWHELTHKNGVDAEKYFNIYCMLIDEIKAALPDIKIMILEPFILKAYKTEEQWDEFRREVEKRAEKAKKVAKKYNLIFVPLQEKFDEASKVAPSEYWLFDGVHPTTAGHEIIKSMWLEGFEQIR